VPIALGQFAYASCMGSWSPPDYRTHVALIEDWVVSALRWGTLACPIVLFVLGFVNRRWFPPPISVLVALFFGCGPAICIGARRLSASETGEDGRAYAFFHQSFFQGRTAFIGRVTESGRFTRTLEVVWPDYEFGFTAARIVRPANDPSDDTRVRVTRDGLVLGLIGPNAYAAVRSGETTAFTSDEVKKLSPFVLLDDTSKGLDSDVDGIVDHVRWVLRVFGKSGGGDEDDVPGEASLLAALDSPNPWIRAATKRIVEAGGAKEYPEATKRLASAPK
jgi:hypothetical protein